MAPAYPPLLMSDTIGYTPERVPNITNYSGWIPSSTVMKGPIQNYRGQGLIKVAIAPAQYRCNHTLRTFSMIKYKVSFLYKGTIVKGKNYVSNSADRNISLSDHFLENTTLNYSLSRNGRQHIRKNSNRPNNTAELDNRGYLIITTDNFLDSVNEFAEWKRTKGFNVSIFSKPVGEWTPTLIKETIAYQYDIAKTTFPIYYLLIVGDVEYVPTDTLGNIQTHISDFYYGHQALRYDTLCIHQGRIPVKTQQEATTVLQKIINYEKNPPIDASFYKTISNIAYFDNKNMYDYEYLNMASLSEQILQYLVNQIPSNYTVNRMYKAEEEASPLLWFNKDSIPVNLRKNNYNWDATYNDIVDATNQGNSIMFYNGHGSEGYWLNLNFGEHHFMKLHNNNKTPVVFSWTCNTGNFGYQWLCFAEKFLKHENGGCVGIYANTNESYNIYSVKIIQNMIDAIWPGFLPFINGDMGMTFPECITPMFSLGEILDYSLHKVVESSNYHSSSDFRLYEAEILHCFGDPSMMLYTDTPNYFSKPDITIRNDSLFVETSDGDARISFHAVNSFHKASYIGSRASFKMRNKNVIVCIDRHNSIPYIIRASSDGFIQNESINDNRVYINDSTIKIGKNVTTTKPEGNVVFDGADVIINGTNVELHPGTSIINSNVMINTTQ